MPERSWVKHSAIPQDSIHLLWLILFIREYPYVNCPVMGWCLPACPMGPLLLFCFLAFCLFVPFFALCPSRNEMFSHPKWKRTGNKITLPVHNSSWKSQRRERASRRGQRKGVPAIFSLGRPYLIVPVINEWLFCEEVRNLPWIRGPSKWMVYFSTCSLHQPCPFQWIFKWAFIKKIAAHQSNNIDTG